MTCPAGCLILLPVRVNKLLLLAGLTVFGAATGCQVGGTSPASSPATVAASKADEASAASATPRGADADLTVFFHELAPLGGWVEHKELGPVWFPYDTSPGWRPYLNGRWVVTDGGELLWAGSEKFGWATDHYGRWVFLDSLGWVWAPDRTWSPANVEWRRGGGYVGWAPLAREKPAPTTGSSTQEASADAMLATTTTAATTTPAPRELPSAFTFVKEGALLAEKVRDKAEMVTGNVTLLERTQPADVKDVVAAIEDGMKRIKVIDATEAGPAKVGDGEVALYRPEIGARPSSAPAIPILTRNQTPLAAEEQRTRQAEYFDQLRDVLEERHEREQQAAKDGDLKDVTARQRRERQALADYRQREVEALRRRQREARELFAAQAEQARIAREKQPPAKPELIPIPKEWELPPGMMRRD